jgi:hypothetical protein
VTRIQLMLEAYVRMGLEHPNAYRLVFMGPIQAATGEIGEQCYARYADVVREIEAEGRLRVGDAASAALALWAACHGLVALMITRPDIKWTAPDELVTLMVDGLLHGLVSR